MGLENKKLKALIIANVFPRPAQPNTGFYIMEQVKRLKEHMDLKVVVASARNFMERYNDKLPNRITYNDFDIFQPQYYTIPKIGVFTSGSMYEKGLNDIVDNIYQEFPFDIIICYWTYPEGFAAGRFAKKYDVPLIIRPRGSDINAYYSNFILRNLIKKSLLPADKVIPVSQNLASTIRKLGIEDEKLSYIHNGIDTKEFQLLDRQQCRDKLEIKGEDPIVLFVGSFIDIKGISYYLDAIRMMDSKGIKAKFLFFGRGPLEDKINNVKNNLKNSTIEIKGDVPHKQLGEWMNASNMLCLPSLMEGCPNVVLEAFACGIPVLASRVGGIPELINDQKFGILFKSADASQIASAVERALEHKWDRHVLFARVQNQSWDNVARKLYENCKDLIKEKEKVSHGK